MNTMYERLIDAEDTDRQSAIIRVTKKVQYRIGRGGFYGMDAEDALEFLALPVKHAVNLPDKVGFSLRDMGGGINIPHVLKVDVMVQHGVPKSVAKKIHAFCNACRKRYIDLQETEE